MPGGVGRLRVRWGRTGLFVVFSLELEDCWLGMNTACMLNVSVCRVEQDPDPASKQTSIKWWERCQAFVLLFMIPRTSAGPREDSALSLHGKRMGWPYPYEQGLRNRDEPGPLVSRNQAV